MADGVGGWSSLGVDPSHFSNALMENAKLYSETHRKELNPEVIMENAFQKVKRDGHVKAGSSTAIIAALQQEGSKTYLDVANVGDSGCLVIRNRSIIRRVHELVHSFNAPFQLAVVPSHMKNCFSDKVSDAVRERVEVEKGDVIVLGTDGLFDNRFNVDIASDAGWVGKVEGTGLSTIPFFRNILNIAFNSFEKEVDYIDPFRVCSRIVQEAYKTSLSKEAESPWASMLRQVGVPDAKGGKVDDITVLIGRISSRSDLNMTTQW
eukprot:Tbor_TRINITY_DN5490_c0_g1::TRINITY_DN5490_c0_g1_i1::g.25301::m.25301/K17508/PTC7, PPTC7; protein phosphatase PTC7